MIKLVAAFEKIVVSVDTIYDKTNNGDSNAALKEVVLIHQGESVDKETAYFYVLYKGKCRFSVDDQVVGYANSGDHFGELALLYDCPRAATVTAMLVYDKSTTNGTVRSTDNSKSIDGVAASNGSIQKQQQQQEDENSTVLFRVHQRDFRAILQQADQVAYTSKMNLLAGVAFLDGLSLTQKENLASAMMPRPFHKGDYLLRKGEEKCSWMLIDRGVARVTNISVNDEFASNHQYQDFMCTSGSSFGERAIVRGDATVGDVIAESEGVAFSVDHDTFREVVGNLHDLVIRSMDNLKIKAIPILAETVGSDPRVLSFLATKVVDQHFPSGTIICAKGQPLLYPAALYLVRKGTVEIEMSFKDDIECIKTDGYFGDDQLMADTIEFRGKYIPTYTAVATEDCTCGVLKLVDCRKVLNTRQMGRGSRNFKFDSLVAGDGDDVFIGLEDLTILKMIGSGTFGQCFLVSRESSNGTVHSYALKVQSKYELCQAGQAKSVVREKNIMSHFVSPFVANLVGAMQDENFVYILMTIYQGGELYNVMHTKVSDILSEDHAKFYVACIAQALRYLHCYHRLVYRDLKPENVMIDEHGYAVLIDFGFCKKLTAMKTYTMCGTPLYLAPEVILNRGHSFSVDHWSLGIVIYEMLQGYTPFYQVNRNKSEVFRAIVKEKVYRPDKVSNEAMSLLSGLLKRDPAKRLGSLADGESGILDHPWFADIDLDQLEFKDINAPFVPTVRDACDVSNFDNWASIEDKRKKKYPQLLPDEEKIFADF